MAVKKAEVIYVGDYASLLTAARGAVTAAQAAADGIAAANTKASESFGEMSVAANRAATEAAKRTAVLGGSMDAQGAAARRAAEQVMGASQQIAAAMDEAGKAAATAAARAGASSSEWKSAYAQAAAAAKASAEQILAAADEAGKAAESQAATLGGSIAQQKAAYAEAAAAAKASADEQIAAARHAADEQGALAATSAKAQAAAAAKQSAARSSTIASMKSIGGTMSRYVTMPIAAAAVAGVDFSMKFQSEMLKIHTQAGASTEELHNMSKAVLELAPHTQQGPQKLSEALYQLESVGVRGSRAMAALKGASEGAAMGNADLEETTSALAAVTTSYDIPATKMQETMGTLDATVGVGKMRMEELVESFHTGILPVAQMAGVSLHSLGADIAVMTDRGVPATRGMTYLRQAIFYLADENTKKAKEALSALGLTSSQVASELRGPDGLAKVVETLHEKMKDLGKGEQLEVLKDLGGGARSASGLVAIYNSLGNSISDVRSKYEKIGEVSKSFHQRVAEQAATMSAKMHEAWAAIQTSLLIFGNSLAPIVVAVAGFVAKVAQAFESLPGPVKDVIGAIAILGAAGGPVLIALGALSSAMLSVKALFAALEGSATAAMLGIDTALGATGVGLILVGLGVAVVELSKHWETVMKALETGTAEAANFIIDQLNTIIEVFNETIGEITGSIGKIHHVVTAAEEQSKNEKEEGISAGSGGSQWVKNAQQTGSLSGHVTPRHFAEELLISIGGTKDEKANEQAVKDLEAWMKQEGGNWHNAAKYNPLNTTLGMRGSKGINSAGVRAYTSWGQGLEATLKTLSSSRYEHIIGALHAGASLKEFEEAVNASAWGTKFGEVGSNPGSHIAHLKSFPEASSANTGFLEAHGLAAKARKVAEAYVSPFAGAHGLVRGREDEGIDFTAAPGSKIGAIGAGVIDAIVKGWFKGQPLIEEKLTSGSHKGQFVYYAEQLKSAVSLGQRVRAGQTIGTVAGSGTGLELGFGAGGGRTLAQATTGYTEGQKTPAAAEFSKFLASLGHGGTSLAVANSVYAGVVKAEEKRRTEILAGLTKEGSSALTKLNSAITSGKLETLTKLVDADHTKALTMIEARLGSIHNVALTKLAGELVSAHREALKTLGRVLAEQAEKFTEVIGEIRENVAALVEKAGSAMASAHKKAIEAIHTKALEGIEHGPETAALKKEKEEGEAEADRLTEAGNLKSLADAKKRLHEAKGNENREEIKEAEEAVKHAEETITQFARTQAEKRREKKLEAERTGIDEATKQEETALEESVKRYEATLNAQLSALVKSLEKGEADYRNYVESVNKILAGAGIVIKGNKSYETTLSTGSGTTNGPTPIVLGSFEQASTPSHASGGMVYPGVTYRVGEVGAEGFTPSAPGSITPASEMARSGGDAHFYGPVTMGSRRDADRFAHKLAHRLAHGGRSG